MHGKYRVHRCDIHFLMKKWISRYHLLSVIFCFFDTQNPDISWEKKGRATPTILYMICHIMTYLTNRQKLICCFVPLRNTGFEWSKENRNHRRAKTPVYPSISSANQYHMVPSSAIRFRTESWFRAELSGDWDLDRIGEGMIWFIWICQSSKKIGEALRALPDFYRGTDNPENTNHPLTFIGYVNHRKRSTKPYGHSSTFIDELTIRKRSNPDCIQWPTTEISGQTGISESNTIQTMVIPIGRF